MNFLEYARYYDTLYSEKNYQDECHYILSLYSKFRDKSPDSILDLGCGTGGHTIPFTKAGFSTTGIDSSEIMLSIAKQKASHENLKINIQPGDIRSWESTQKFDLAISMFAVMSYQTSNADLLSVFQNVRRQLAPNGLFIFDAWYGPAVLSLKPEEKSKVVRQNNLCLIRLTRPTLLSFQNTVNVNFRVYFIEDDKVKSYTEEDHLMRYFFNPEIEIIANHTGFRLLDTCVFMQADKKPTENDWNASWILEAI